MNKHSIEEQMMIMLVNMIRVFLRDVCKSGGVMAMFHVVNDAVFDAAEMELSGLNMIFKRLQEEVTQYNADTKSGDPQGDDPILVHRIECLCNDLLTLSAIHLEEM